MDVAAASWPLMLAQETAPPGDAPGTPAPGTPAGNNAPADTSPPPASSNGDGTSAPGATGTTQAPGTPGNGQNPDAAPPPGGMGSLFLPLILVFVVLMLFTMGGGRKEKKRRAALLSSLRKGSKIQTVGGVLGTVVEVRDDEVLVKVDENANTRIRFAKSAINAVTSEE